jgi:hypothetical protein
LLHNIISDSIKRSSLQKIFNNNMQSYKTWSKLTHIS